MAYTIPRHGVIDYPASALRDFHVYGYEWIDDLHFIRPPREFLPLPDEQVERYLTVARERFSEAGWHGDGDIGLLWLPPFVFPLDLKIHPTGVLLWHVKQGYRYCLSYGGAQMCVDRPHHHFTNDHPRMPKKKRATLTYRRF